MSYGSTWWRGRMANHRLVGYETFSVACQPDSTEADDRARDSQ